MYRPSLLLIGGPTASGKSARAMQLARQHNGVIINADSMQIYSGLPILTAQPNAQDQSEIRHLLYEITDAGESSSVGKWLAKAHLAIEQTLSLGQTPILVGGTGMYFEALLGGLAAIPPIPEKVRHDVECLYLKIGEEKFRSVLAECDPESASQIARNDRQRLIRALSVHSHTGKSLKVWQRQAKENQPWNSMHIEKHLLLPPREVLYSSCDIRFKKMIETGALEEVKSLMLRDLSPALPASKILGVRELAAYLRDEITLDAAIAKAQQMTRNYAKRQITWFSNRWKITPD